MLYTFDRGNGGHKLQVSCLCYVKELNYLISGSRDNSIKVWSLNNGSLIHSFDHTNRNSHSGWINSIKYFSNGLMVTASDDNKIKVWNLKDGSLKQTFEHDNIVYCLASLSDSLVASGSWDNTIKIWDISKGSLVHTFNTSNSGLTSWTSRLVVTTNGLLVSGLWDGTIKVWDLDNYDLLFTFDGRNGGHKKTVYALEPLFCHNSSIIHIATPASMSFGR